MVNEVEMKKKKRKKKKARPSQLDLQKQSHGHELPNSAPKQQPFQNCRNQLCRSTRRNPDRDGASSSDDHGGEKKLKLVLKLPNSSSGGGEEPEADAGDDADSKESLKKRKIAAIGNGSGHGVSFSEKEEKLSKTGNGLQGSAWTKLDSGTSTPLPDKKALLFILDRLQKKDTYGVFSEPVDPEELPDYHDIIENPMDFGTVRKKLDKGGYAKLEEFESDVFLICSNAMQYNAPSTVYFRQARSIQELARKNFDNLRQGDDNNPLEPKVVRRGRPPTKHLKRPPGRPALDRAGSSDATLATGGENAKPADFDFSKGPLSVLVNSSGRRQSNDVYTSWLLENRFERNNDNSGSSSRASPMNCEKKQTVPDEFRRNTYRQCDPSTSGRETSVLATFNRERKHLILVGLQADHGYARSLARFSANLGPIAWKVASRSIEKSMPAGIKLGPGWVGERNYVTHTRFQLSSPALSSLWPLSVSGSSGPKDTDSASADENLLSDKPEGERSNSLEKPQPLVLSGERLLPSGNHMHALSEDRKEVEVSISISPPFQSYQNGFGGPFGYNIHKAAALTRTES